MKKSIWRKPFDPAAEYVVIKTLRFGGRTFKTGQLFNAKTTDRKKRLLFQSRYLDFKPEDQKPVLVESPPIKPLPIESASVQSEPEPEPEPESTQQSTSEVSPTTARITLANRGWYNVVDADGNQINKTKLRMKDAEELVKQMR